MEDNPEQVILERVHTYQSALRDPQLPSEDRGGLLELLGDALMASYNLSFSTQTLEEAIGVYEETLQSRPSGHDRRAKSLDDFGDALWYFCVQHVTDRARIEQCVASLREALQLRGHGHPLRDRSLHKLARALFAVRYQHLGGRDALEESISLNREALQLRPVGHPDRDKSLNNLAVALTKSFENYGDPRDLIEAIDVQREDLQLCPPGHPDRTISLDSLGNALYVLYQFSSGSETLAESISLLREALDLRPVGHPRRVAALHNLANALMINFSHEGQSDSLQEAVDLNHQALFLMPETYPDRALMMNSAATALLHSFREHGGSAKLAEVIRLYREALKLQPPGHPTRDIALNNLGEGLQVVFDEYQDTGALLEAVALHREVFELRSLSAFERLRATENLAQLHCRPECQSWIQALAWYREALDMCPAGFPSRSRLLSGMSSCFLDPGSPAFEISAAIGCLAEGYADNFTHINQRLRLSVVDLRRVEDAHRATLERSGASSAAQESEQILHLYVQVIELLPRAANFGLDHRSRLQALAGSDEISRNAAARAVLLERVPQAVELLEEGRGIFWSQCLHMRVTGFDGVPYSDRQRLEELFRLLKNGAHRLQSSDHTSAQRERDLEARRQLNVEAEALIAKIRSHPGLDRFLLPATFQTLINSLPDGYVVVVNASRFGHHALLLSRTAGLAQSLVLKPLRTAFDSAALRMHLPRDIKLDAEPKDETSAGTRAMRLVDTGRRSIDHVLSLLWENVAQPIIKKLRLQRANGRSRPRLWWCVTGELGFLPIHAAGSYHDASPACTTDYVVSSYVPTLSALTKARRGWTSIRREQLAGVLISEVSSDDNNSARYLAHAADEVRIVRECFETAKARVLNTPSEHTSLSELCTLLEGTPAHILHLACHGIQESDPLKSAIVLQDGRLTIEDIMQFELPHAMLAFLSACQTAKGDRNAPDQAVHLAASMLFCGFRSVIGTMWLMHDNDGPMMARSVYESLFAQDYVDLDDVAFALDDAVHVLRAEGVPVSRWALFMHMGG